MFSGWFDKNRCPIGIDLGAHSIKMLQLERRGGGWSAVAASSRTLPADLPASGLPRVEALAPIVRQMLDGAPFVGRKVVSCLPATAIQYKNLRLPKMPADELRAAVEWEATDRLHLPGQGVNLQFFDAGEVRQGDEVRQEIILLAAPTSVIDEHLELLVQCDLQPAAIDAVPSALARSMTGCGEVDLDAPAKVAVDVGYSSSKVLIVRNGRVLFFKLIDIGGRKFDETIAKHLNLSLQDACDLRRRLHGLDGRQADDQALFGAGRRENVERAVYEALRTAVGELAREVGLCLRYYSVTFRGRRPDGLELVGGEAYEPQLAKVMTDECGIQVNIAKALDQVDLSKVDDLLTGPESCSEWAVAAGLSMRPSNIRQAKRGAA